MVINLSPSITNENETTSSLQFAERLKKVKLEVRSKTNPVQGKIMHLKQELEQERHKRTELEYKLQQHMKEKQPDISQVHGELNRYKDQNVKLEQTLDKLLLFSCKNMNGNQLQQEFVECEVLGEKLKRISADRRISKNDILHTPERETFNKNHDQFFSSAKQKLNDSLNFD